MRTANAGLFLGLEKIKFTNDFVFIWSFVILEILLSKYNQIVTSAMRLDEWIKPEIEDGKLTKYNWLVQHSNNLKLGDRTDIGAFTYINAKYGVTIEDNVQIGSHCSIYSQSTIDNKKGTVILKQNCKIGSHSTIMPNIIIGENSIIGAHSFVNTSIPDNTLAYGVPVKCIRNLSIKKSER